MFLQNIHIVQLLLALGFSFEGRLEGTKCTLRYSKSWKKNKDSVTIWVFLSHQITITGHASEGNTSFSCKSIEELVAYCAGLNVYGPYFSL